MARRHDLIAISIIDRRELMIPALGLLELADAETGECRVVDSSDPAFRSRFEEMGRLRQRGLARLFGSLSVDHIPIVLEAGETKEVGHIDELVRFFKRREARR